MGVGCTRPEHRSASLDFERTPGESAWSNHSPCLEQHDGKTGSNGSNLDIHSALCPDAASDPNAQ